MTVKYSRANTPLNLASAGTQCIPPGGVRPARRAKASEEILFVTKGSGVVKLDGAPHALAPETLIFVGRNTWVEIASTGDDDLEFFWVRSPPGPLSMAALMGQPRQVGQSAPAPFDPPAGSIDLAARMAVEVRL
jgi:hypothetical protein